MPGLLSHIGLLIKPSGPNLWTPLNLSYKPVVLLDKDSAATISQWSDRSGNNFHFTQATGTAQPSILTPGVTGVRSYQFDGTTDYFRSTTSLKDSFKNISGGWILSMFKKDVADAGGVNRNLVANAPGNAGGGGRHSLGTLGNKLYYYSERVDAGASAILQSTTALGTTAHIALSTVNWVQTKADIRLDGVVDISSAAFGTTGLTSNTTAAWDAGINAFVGASPAVICDGQQVVVAEGSTDLTVLEKEKLEGWAAWSHGGSSLLAVGHRYKSAAPLLTYDPNTKSYVHFEDVTGSIQFRDHVETNRFAAVNDAKILTTQTKFRSSSGFFDGVGDRVTGPMTAAYQVFQQLELCFEGWFYLSGNSPSEGGSRNAVLDSFNIPTTGSFVSCAVIEILGNGTTTGTGLAIELWDAAGVTTNVYSNITISQGAWHYYRITRNSAGTWTIEMDGTSYALTNNSIGSSLLTLGSGGNRSIGGTQNTVYTRALNGYLSEIRMSNIPRVGAVPTGVLENIY